MAFSTIILAAGRGTRMKTSLPKVLHPVAGQPMISRVVRAAQLAGAEEVRTVVGYGEALVRKVLEPLEVSCHLQKEQLGTADAVKSAQPENMEGTILILNGDHPLITPGLLKSVLGEFNESQADFAVVTAKLKEPGDFGRIVRHKGELKAIVEARDASHDTLEIKEVNTGIYCVKAEVLNTYLPRIKNFNAKKEYYFTDILSLCQEGGEKVVAILGHRDLSFGVNSQWELAKATKTVFLRKAKALMDEGVVIIDPATTYIEDTVQVGPASVIYPNVFLRGGTRLGSFCVVESNSFLSDAVLADMVQVKASTYIERSVLNEKATVGPFARLRPETEIGTEAHVGNFVEMKKVKFGDRSKAGHLTYLGDASVGNDTNIGCGTITCNYAVDRKKYKTSIGNNVFVGSDTQFVAPVSVGDHAVVASGSTITKNVPSFGLAVARSKQYVKENYVKPPEEKSSSNSGDSKKK